MELGVARFLEMFEERFGRRVTTLLLGALAIAAAAWAVQTTIEAAVYVYRLFKSADLIAALRKESAASHLIVFGIQMAVTYVALWAIWRWFFGRKLREFRGTMDARMAEIREAQKKFDQAMATRQSIDVAIKEADAAFGKLLEATRVLQAITEKAKTLPPGEPSSDGKP
jgi:hypothetical protein